MAQTDLSFQNKIAQENAANAGCMFAPCALGADKTTVSVGTGSNEFYPLYFVMGNLTNEARRAHRNGVLPLAFLAIPKGTISFLRLSIACSTFLAARQYDNDAQFRTFRRQLYHASISAIMQPLKASMSTPEVVLCPDGHYRRAIFGMGPFIADYPEQALLACIVQGWCPKCVWAFRVAYPV